MVSRDRTAENRTLSDAPSLDRRRLMALGASGVAGAILPGCATVGAAAPRRQARFTPAALPPKRFTRR
jgi:hypothetical protein